MKRILFSLLVFVVSIARLQAQCIQNCSGYSLSPITYSLFPTAGNNPSSSFSPNSDDGYSSPVPIGFNFDFYCGTYSTVLICTNGFIVFGNIAPSINGSDPAQSLPSPTSPNGMVSLNMNDFDPGTSGTITYTTIGTTPNQMFIVTYSDVPIWYNAATNSPSTTVLNSGQIILYETSNTIEIHTASVGLSPYPGTQGIENTTGTAGIPVPGRNNVGWSGSNSAYRWEKTLIGTPPTGIDGNTVVCFGDVASYSVNTMPGATAYNWALPSGWTGNSNTPLITATTGIIGSVSVTATYSCGTSAPTVISVTVNPPPIISITSVAPPAVCSGNTVSIDVNGGVSYTLEPGTIIGTPPFVINAADNTTYSVTGTNTNGCVNPSPVTVPLVVYTSPTITVNSGSICLGETFTLLPTGATIYSFSSLFSNVTPTASGLFSYLVVGTASNSCSGSAISGVTVQPIPNTFASATRTFICDKETTTLTASGAASYTWTHNNSTTISQTISPTLTTSYSLTGINQFGCKKEAAVMVVVSPCAGLEAQSINTEHLAVFPNPSDGLFKVSSPDAGMLILYDMNGRELWNKSIDTGTQELNLQDYAKGTYLLKYVTQESQQRLILIKE